MGDDGWRELDDAALERRLVERWLMRGVTLAIILLAAIAATWIGTRTREAATLIDYVTVATLVAVALSAGAAGFTMRREELRIQRELRRRRAGTPRLP